jgi:hypothetical protein
MPGIARAREGEPRLDDPLGLRHVVHEGHGSQRWLSASRCAGVRSSVMSQAVRHSRPSRNAIRMIDTKPLNDWRAVIGPGTLQAPLTVFNRGGLGAVDGALVQRTASATSAAVVGNH